MPEYRPRDTCTKLPPNVTHPVQACRKCRHARGRFATAHTKLRFTIREKYAELNDAVESLSMRLVTPSGGFWREIECGAHKRARYYSLLGAPLLSSGVVCALGDSGWFKRGYPLSPLFG